MSPGPLGRLPAAAPGRTSALLWLIALGALLTGIVTWATGSLQGGVIAMWAFVVLAVALALVLPLPAAFVSPLYAGVLGWLVDMLPLVILAGWAAVVARWVYGLIKERRPPRGGRWIWLPMALAFWTALGIAVVPATELKHFLLILGIQVIASGIVLAAVDSLRSLEERTAVAAGLVAVMVLFSVVVLAEYLGAPIQELANEEVSERVEEAYGVDAFPNNLGLIKYGRSTKAGAREFRAEMERFAEAHPDLPPFEVFLPKFQAYENHLVVRFDGSARAFEEELAQKRVSLIYDNIGLAPANTVPRFRSLARNSLTYAGMCVALLPLAFFLAWRGEGRRRWLGRVGAAAALMGAGFSLARGAWAAILVGVVYLLVDAVLPGRKKVQVAASFVAGAVLLTAIFLIKYDVEPLHARAEGAGSINTRQEVYVETLQSLGGVNLLIGFGTEQPRTAEGTSHVLGRYVPDAGTHSTYLNFLFRTGIPGGLMLIALYAVAWLKGRATSRAAAGEERDFSALTTVAVVMVAAHGVVLSLFVEPIYTLTVSLLLGLTLSGAPENGALSPRRRRAANP